MCVLGVCGRGSGRGGGGMGDGRGGGRGCHGDRHSCTVSKVSTIK